jgi:integrase
MPKITKRFVESIPPDSEKVLLFWDDEIRGFGVVVRPGGRQTYCVQYRNKQRILRRLKLGVHGQITAEEARALAKQHLGSVSHGEDPLAQKKALKHLPSIKELSADYIERYGKNKRPRSLKEDQLLLQGHIVPKLGDKKVVHLSRRDVESFHAGLKETPYQANRVLALLSKMMSLAVAWGWRADHPVKGVPRFPEEKRDRWLDKEELSRLWSVLDSYTAQPSAFFFKLLLLTGARKSELLQASWDHFDLEKGVWTKPSSLTKQKKREYLPLSEGALAVLQQLKALNPDSPYLFPGVKQDRPMQNVQTFWRIALKKAGLADVRIHDLRHTHASHLVSSGLSLSIVGKLLGHTQAATTQRYAHLADESLRHATSLFDRKLKEVMSNTTR